MRPILDLADLATRRGKREKSLVGLYNECFGTTCSKDNNVQRSDWENSLTVQQTNYAENDVLMGWKIYEHLK